MVNNNTSKQIKESRISVKVEPALKTRLEGVVESTGIGEASLVRACVVALCDYIEANKEVTIPFAVLPKRELDRLLAAVK